MPITKASRAGFQKYRLARKMRIASLASGVDVGQTSGVDATPARFISASVHVGDCEYVTDDSHEVRRTAEARLVYADRLTRSSHPWGLELIELECAMERAGQRQNDESRRRSKQWARIVLGYEAAISSQNGSRRVKPWSGESAEVYAKLLRAKARVVELERELKETR